MYIRKNLTGCDPEADTGKPEREEATASQE